MFIILFLLVLALPLLAITPLVAPLVALLVALLVTLLVASLLPILLLELVTLKPLPTTPLKNSLSYLESDNYLLLDCLDQLKEVAMATSFRPPSIHNGSDSDNASSETERNEDEGNDDDENGHHGDIDDHLLGLDDNEIQSALNSEAIQIFGDEWADEEGDGEEGDDEEDDKSSHGNPVYHNRHSHSYQTEVPKWSSSTRSLSRNELDDNSEEVHHTMHQGNRLILLRQQSPELRQVVALGEKTALRQALSNTFFIINDSGYTALTTMLEKVAADLNFPHLVVAFRQDIQFSQNIARIIYHRLTLRRSKIKRIAESLVGFFFGFDNTNAKPETIQNKVNTLSLKSAYIFPIEDDGSMNTTKPYEHPVIIRTLRKFLFDDGARKSTLGETNFEIFSSSFSNVPEMPVGLVCLAATGVHAAISDWSTGVYKRSDFVVDIVEDVFKGHQEYLKTLEKKSPSKYHALLHRIYTKTRAYLPTIGHTIAQGLSDLIDFDGMEDLDESTTVVEESESSSAASFSSTVSQSL